MKYYPHFHSGEEKKYNSEIDVFLIQMSWNANPQ